MLSHEKIQKLITDRKFLELKNKQQSVNLFKTLAASYLETWHSAFLSWLLDPSSYHGLGDYPLKRFLYVVWRECHIGEGRGQFMMPLHTIEALNLHATEIWTEYPNDSLQRTKGKARVDVYAYAQNTKGNGNGSLRLVIENKVKAREHGDQTQVYYDFFSQLDHEPSEIAYVFLTPRDSDEPKCNKFVRLTYQSLTDYVIGPCLRHPSLTQEGHYLLTQYAANLRIPLNNGVVMALPDVELCREIYHAHKDVLDEIFLAVKGEVPTSAGSRRQAIRTGTITLGQLINTGFLSITDQLVATHKGVSYTATLKRDSEDLEPTIFLSGQEYTSPSQAGKIITQKSVNGWTFWRVVDADGTEKGFLSDLRKKLESSGDIDTDTPEVSASNELSK